MPYETRNQIVSRMATRVRLLHQYSRRYRDAAMRTRGLWYCQGRARQGSGGGYRLWGDSPCAAPEDAGAFLDSQDPCPVRKSRTGIRSGQSNGVWCAG
jgi:hypothetical protein